jgi:hypothetical protein
MNAKRKWYACGNSTEKPVEITKPSQKEHCIAFLILEVRAEAKAR